MLTHDGKIILIIIYIITAWVAIELRNRGKVLEPIYIISDDIFSLAHIRNMRNATPFKNNPVIIDKPYFICGSGLSVGWDTRTLASEAVANPNYLICVRCKEAYRKIQAELEG